MTNLELVLNMLAEATTKEISKNENPTGFIESKKVAKRGGHLAGKARLETEKELGKSIISSKNAEEIHFKKKKLAHKKK